MSLSAAQIQQFKTDGYCVAQQLFSDTEISAMRAELDRLREAGAFHNVRTEGDRKTQSQQKMNLQICPLYNKSNLFRALPFAPQVVPAVSQLIGNPVRLHLDQVFLKPAHHGDGTNWHQDNAYFKIDDPFKGTAMWIAIHDATVANGTLHLLPKTAHLQFEHKADPYSNHHIRCWPDESTQVAVEVPAGGAVFFCYGLPHCTKANTTDNDRAGLAYHFLHESCYATCRGGAKPVGTVLSGAENTGGLSEYGVKVAGTWMNEVSHALKGSALPRA